MEKLPYDIALLVFEVYVHDLHCSPTSLLSVCQKWKQSLLASPTLWTRVNIFFDSIHCVTRMLENKTYGLEAYLSRSEGSDGQFPLDINLRCSNLKNMEEEHVLACGCSPSEESINQEMPCKLPKLLQAQLHRIFAVLFGMDRNNRASQSRLNRWTTLRADMSYFAAGKFTGDAVTLLPLQKKPIKLSFPNLHTIILRDLCTNYPCLDLLGLKRLELWGISALVDSPSICRTKYLRFEEFAPNLLRVEFPWRSCQVEVLELSGSFDTILDMENSLPALKTLILHSNVVNSIDWNNMSRRFDASRPLHTIMFLGFSIENVSAILQWVPWLEIQNWKLTCECYERPPTDLIPSYYTKEVCCEFDGSTLEAASDFLTLIQERGLRAESLDTCTTRLFEVALRGEVQE